MTAEAPLDRAARAAHAAMHPDGTAWDELPPPDRESVRDGVRAALSTLRDPDQHTAVRGLVELGTVAEEQGQRLTTAFADPRVIVRQLATGLTPHDATRIWRVMVDAVLARSPES